MHAARILTALILLPLVLFLILKGSSTLLLITVGGCSLLGWHEMARMAKLPGPVFVAGALALSLGYAAQQTEPGLWAGLFFFLCFYLKNYDPQKTLKQLCLAFAGYTYVFLGFIHLYFLTTLPQGRFWLLFLMACVFGTDTGAFYAGKTLGKHRLIPRVSPKKTWEGAAGGTLLGTALGLLWGYYADLAGTGFLLAEALSLSLIGQLGDLLESIFKRGLGVKDSGSLLPGHGGILDRTDALIFAAPFLYWGLVLKDYVF